MVGRDEPEQTLRSALAGPRSLLLVLGDAGIGKTRLVTEALRGLDGLVLQGACLPMGRQLPLLPIFEALGDGRQEVTRAVSEARQAMPDGLRAVVAPLLAATGASPSAPLSDAGGREQLFIACRSLLGPWGPVVGWSWSSRTSTGPTRTPWTC